MAAKGKVTYRGDAVKIIEKLGKEHTERAVKTLSLDAHTYARFEKICTHLKMKPSHVIDELLAGFVADAETQIKKAK